MAEKTFTASSFADFDWDEIQKFHDDNNNNEMSIKGTRTYTFGNGVVATFEYIWTQTNIEASYKDDIKNFTAKEMLAASSQTGKRENGYSTNNKVYSKSNIKGMIAELNELTLSTRT